MCLAARPAAPADKPAPPRLPLAVFWTADLGGDTSAPPVRDGDRVFIPLKSAHLTARAVSDGHELWRIDKNVTVAMAADKGILFIAAGEAVEGVRAADGRNAWLVPRLKPVAPLVVRAGLVIVVTESEMVAIGAADGQVAWRHPAGGVHLSPAIDGDYVYAGANDGRLLALTLASGTVAWEQYLSGGVTALAAYGGRVYAGAGDKQIYCLDGRSGKSHWSKALGSIPAGRIAVDDDRVYVAALSNVVYGLDRVNGNQRWTSPIRRRSSDGVFAAGHVLFVPTVADQLSMFYDRTGQPSGSIGLPGDMARDAPLAVGESDAGVNVFAVTGGLSNEWRLTFIGPADETSIAPFSALTEMPGVPFLTDPVLEPIGRVLGELIFGDPILQPVSAMEWPLVLRDPPLEPLTALPGIQLRPLSPVLPSRRGG